MSIEVRKDYLAIDGKPVFIFGGDLSYCRIPRRAWKERMLQMRDAGLNTVTVYIVWCYHQPAAHEFDFAEERDLGYFLDLIGECGMYCIFRMGPFVHGEYRNGGLPQWLVDELGDKVRTNDPQYLEYAKAWYEKLIDILKPRLHANRGPVILLQLENELGSAGCKGDDLSRGAASVEENGKHLLFYYNLIRGNGIDLPLLDINHIPDKEKLIQPLVDSGGMYPVNCFCCDGDLRPFSVQWWEQHVRPKITVETGGGMFVRYYDTPAYRNTNGFQGPLVRPELIEASVLTHIAEGCSGVNLYIFCDGQNPDGCGEHMLPERDMNYQAPITVSGRLRDSYWKLKRIGWFMRSFEQEILGSSPDPDWASVRACGTPHPGTEDGGDLFENYEKQRENEQQNSRGVPAMARITKGLNLSESNFLFLRNVFNVGSGWKRDVKTVVSPSGLACEVWQEYPKKVQMELPPQTMKVMPFFIRLRPGHFLEYSTAELLDRRTFGDKTMVTLYESEEVMTETRLVIPAVDSIRSTGNVLILRESPNSVTLIARPERHPIVVETPELRILLITKSYAEHLWDIGNELAWSSSPLNGSRREITTTVERSEFCLEWMTEDPPGFESGLTDVCEDYDAERNIYRLSGCFELPSPVLNWKRSYCGENLILTGLLPDLPPNAEDIILTLHYNGSFGQAFVNDCLVSDHAYGRFLPWDISLRDLINSGRDMRIICRQASDCQISAAVRVRRVIHFR